MPRYDYACQKCGQVVEVMHGVNESGPAHCERCGGETRKLMSRPAIVFKGSGWAKKDRSSKPTDKSKSTTESETKSTTESETKSTTESETKSSQSAHGQSAKPSPTKPGSASDA